MEKEKFKISNLKKYWWMIVLILVYIIVVPVLLKNKKSENYDQYASRTDQKVYKLTPPPTLQNNGTAPSIEKRGYIGVKIIDYQDVESIQGKENLEFSREIITKYGTCPIIVGFIEGSPAQKSGLQVNDMIVSIDGRNTRDMSSNEVSPLISGNIGSKVILSVIRKDWLKPQNFEIERVDLYAVNNPPTSWETPGWDMPTAAKPIIYLYPQKPQETLVQLNYNGTIIADYPKYNDEIKGWKILAYPDGHLTNLADNKEYSYLFWEGQRHNSNYDLSKGFVVKGTDTQEFLQDKLKEIGLTPKEYNEFIVYWYPKMKDNKYNLIHFAGEEYTNEAKLDITPKPDSLLRVFMAYKPLEEYISIKPQEFPPFERNGFTVVEWGGSEIN